MEEQREGLANVGGYGRAAEAQPDMGGGSRRSIADGVVWFGRLEEEEDKR